MWTYPWATVPSEVYLLWHRHNHGHRRFEVYLLWHGLIHGHRCFTVSCSHVDSSTGHSPFNLSSHWSSNLSSTAAQKEQRCYSLRGGEPEAKGRSLSSQGLFLSNQMRWAGQTQTLLGNRGRLYDTFLLLNGKSWKNFKRSWIKFTSRRMNNKNLPLMDPFYL